MSRQDKILALIKRFLGFYIYWINEGMALIWNILFIYSLAEIKEVPTKLYHGFTYLWSKQKREWYLYQLQRGFHRFIHQTSLDLIVVQKVFKYAFGRGFEFIKKWLFSTNHKDIGTLYLIFSLGAGAMVPCYLFDSYELATPGDYYF